MTKTLVWKHLIPDERTESEFGEALSRCAGTARYFGSGDVFIMKRSVPWLPSPHFMAHGIRNPAGQHPVVWQLVAIWRVSAHFDKRHHFSWTHTAAG